ncbi:MAG: carboxypeptidase regulatory-like domain-containing protein [Gemmatimonadota bacterium]|nr:carboxypeptidase regulatory-like domain-containing protein [Gemmatimonadota bacterium]
MKFRSCIWMTWSLALLGSGAAAAQNSSSDTVPSDGEGVRVIGRVTDRSTQRPLPSASVRLIDVEDDERLAWEGASDSTGTFRGPRVRPSTYRVRVEALGYGELVQSVPLSGYGTVELMVELSPSALELDPLVVVSRRRSRLESAGFYDRRRRGFGHTLNRREIEDRHPSTVTDLVRAMPGVSVAPGGLGTGGIIRMRGGCIPDVILDGARLSGPVRLDNLLSVSDLEGLEVYSGSTTPAQYSTSSCGTVLAWTRDPGSTDGRPWSWKRAGAAAGFILLSILLTS